MIEYSDTERREARNAARRLSDLSKRLISSRMKAVSPRKMDREAAEALTGSVDPETQIKKLLAMSEQFHNQHLDRLYPHAKEDFNAFCEVMVPDEPPTSPWLEFLTQTLESIEKDPTVNNLILNCPPGHAKPVSVHTPVQMGDGTWKPLGQIKIGDEVLTHKNRARKVQGVHQQGKLSVVKITTDFGREIISALDHPFLLRNGSWKKAADLQPGDPLQIIRRPLRDSSGQKIAMFRFMAFFDGCGCIGAWTPKNGAPKTNAIRLFTSSEPVMRQATTDAASLGFILRKYPNRRMGGYACNLDAPARDKLAELTEVYAFQKQRRVPKFVFQGDRKKIGAYVETLLNAKGEATKRINGPNIRFYAQSENFVRDVASLLSDLGVDCTLDLPAAGEAGRPMLQLGPDNVMQFYAAGLKFSGWGADTLAQRMSLWSRPAPEAGLDSVVFVEAAGKAACGCLTVADDHTFSASGVAVKNSTYASRLFVCWRMGRDPDQKVLGAGHTQNFVEKQFSKLIRDYTQTEPFAKVFPGFAIDSASRANDQWNVAGYKGQYVARGVGQSIHGFRFNTAIVDDPYPSISKAKSPAYREEVRTFVLGDIGTRMLPGGKTFVIMTRFHSEDITQTLLDMNPSLPDEAKFIHIAVPAICYDQEKDVMGRSEGELLWDFYKRPHFIAQLNKLGYQQYSLIHQQMTQAINPDSIASQFQYYEELPHLSKEALREAGTDEHGEQRIDRAKHFRRVVLSVDTATKDTARADYSVAQVWGETHDRKHYLFDEARKKVEFNDLIVLIERLARKWNVDTILVEDKGNGSSYIQNRAPKNGRRLAPAPVVAISVDSKQSKATRFDSIAPMIEAGEVFVPKDPLKHPWLDPFMQEIGQFPDGAHDDQVDALTQYLRWVRSKRQRFGTKKIIGFG